MPIEQEDVSPHWQEVEKLLELVVASVTGQGSFPDACNWISLLTQLPQFNGRLNDIDTQRFYDLISESIKKIANRYPQLIDQELMNTRQDVTHRKGYWQFRSPEQLANFIDGSLHTERLIAANVLPHGHSEKYESTFATHLAAALIASGINHETLNPLGPNFMKGPVGVATAYKSQFLEDLTVFAKTTTIEDAVFFHHGLIARLLRIAYQVGAITFIPGTEFQAKWNDAPPTDQPKKRVEIVLGYNPLDQTIPIELMFGTPQLAAITEILLRTKEFVDIEFHLEIIEGDLQSSQARLDLLNALIIKPCFPEDSLPPIVIHMSIGSGSEANIEDSVVQLLHLLSEEKTAEIAFENCYHAESDSSTRYYANGSSVIEVIRETLNLIQTEYQRLPEFGLTIDLAHFNCSADGEEKCVMDVLTGLAEIERTLGWKPNELIIHLSQNRQPEAGNLPSDDHLPHLVENYGEGFVKLASGVTQIFRYGKAHAIPVHLITEQTGPISKEDVDYIQQALDAA